MYNRSARENRKTKKKTVRRKDSEAWQRYMRFMNKVEKKYKLNQKSLN